MKKITTALLSMGALSTATLVHAQSSVTLYGLIENSISFGHNVAGDSNQLALLAGNLSGPRWGLKVSEDIGGGTRAVATLENGFDPNTGKLANGGAEFGRQAYVGVKNDQWGSLTAGRQYTPDTFLVQAITADNYLGSVFATPGDVDNYDNSYRVSNALAYASPVIHGFQAIGMYALGNQAGSVGSRRAWGGAVAYNQGSLALAASYQYYDGGAASGVREFANTTTDSIFYSPVTAAYSSAAAIKIARAAAQYTIGSLNLGASYSNTQFTADGASTFAETQKFNTINLFTTYQFTPALLAGAGATYEKSSGNSSAKYWQFSLGADYFLSKRTDLYLVGAWQRATGTQDPEGTAAQPSIGSYGFAGAAGKAQQYAALGLRHKF
jgi:predicted porin